MGSTPYPGTIQDLTFNLFSILADNRLLANALFWITVWITAKGHGPWTTDRGYWSRFCIRFGCLVKGWGLLLRGLRFGDRGPLMGRQIH